MMWGLEMVKERGGEVVEEIGEGEWERDRRRVIGEW